MAKENAGKSDHREEAERILNAIGGTMSAGTPAEDVAGAIVGAGFALLAIHDELQAIRMTGQAKDKPVTLPGAKERGAQHLEALRSATPKK